MPQDLETPPTSALAGNLLGVTNVPIQADKITTFTAPGTFTKDPANAPGLCNVLVAGGGGGGGNGIAGVCFGGGGAGSYASDTASATFPAPGGYAVVIGGAGGGSSAGSTSSFGEAPAGGYSVPGGGGA